MPRAFPGIRHWPAPKGEWWSTNARRRGQWVMFGDTRRATAILNLNRWPPKAVGNRGEFVVSFDTLPDGRFVVCSMLTRPAGEYAIRIHPPAWVINPAAAPAIDPVAGTTEVYPSPGGLTMVEVWAISGRVVAYDTLIRRDEPPASRRAYLLDRGGFVEAPGLPPVTKFGQYGHQAHANGKVILATGEEVLIWDGNGYEWTGKAFERRWELAAKEPEMGGQIGVPWGRDGFFFLSNRRVMHARRGKRPVRVHTDAENVYLMSPGPQDSVILCQGRNDKSFVARFWFPEDGTYTPLLRSHLGWGSSGAPPDLYWSAATGHTHFTPLYTLPDADLLALMRVKPRGKGYQVPKT